MWKNQNPVVQFFPQQIQKNPGVKKAIMDIAVKNETKQKVFQYSMETDRKTMW